MNSKAIKLIIVAIFAFSPVLLNAMNMNQLVTLNKDGSGILKLTYWEKESIVKDKNSMVGSFPFLNEKAEEYFKSTTTFIKGFKVEKYPSDNTYSQVSVIIGFNDINKINQMKALSESQISLVTTDTGAVFSSIITPAFVKTNSIDNLFMILTYEGGIKSSNGTIKGQNIEWFRSKEYLNTNKNISFFATIESMAKTDTTKKDGGKEKSCGLFGLELPFILLLGLIYSTKLRKRN